MNLIGDQQASASSCSDHNILTLILFQAKPRQISIAAINGHCGDQSIADLRALRGRTEGGDAPDDQIEQIKSLTGIPLEPAYCRSRVRRSHARRQSRSLDFAHRCSYVTDNQSRAEAPNTLKPSDRAVRLPWAYEQRTEL